MYVYVVIPEVEIPGFEGTLTSSRSKPLAEALARDETRQFGVPHTVEARIGSAHGPKAGL